MASGAGNYASLHGNGILRGQDYLSTLRPRRKPAEIKPGNLPGREDRNYFCINMPGRAYRLRNLGRDMAEG